MDQEYKALVENELKQVNNLIEFMKSFGVAVPSFKNSYLKACWLLAQYQRTEKKAPEHLKTEAFKNNLKTLKSDLTAFKEYSELFE